MRRHPVVSATVGPAGSSQPPVLSDRWLCDECWQVEELAESGSVDMPGEVTLDGLDEGRPGGGKDLAAFGAESGMDGPTVSRVALADEKPALLQAVDGLGHRALGDTEPLGDLDHAQPAAWGHGHLAEHQVLGEGQPDARLQVSVDEDPDAVDDLAEPHPRLEPLGPFACHVTHNSQPTTLVDKRTVALLIFYSE